MTVLPDGEKSMHGERVGFSTLSLMICRGLPEVRRSGGWRFCRDCGVRQLSRSSPCMATTTFAGCTGGNAGRVLGCRPREELCDAEIVDILKATDALGRRIAARVSNVPPPEAKAGGPEAELELRLRPLLRAYASVRFFPSGEITKRNDALSPLSRDFE